MAVRLLLINPRPPESFWSFRWATDRILGNVRALNPPLGLATLAALCPEDWQVRIVDEAVEPVPVQPDADIVGVCGMGVQHARQRELLTEFRQRGYFTVAGGSYASLCPEAFTGLADCVVSGEAERIWPAFCRDWAAGTVRGNYQETGTVSLDEVPVPRFDLLALDRYSTASLQFSRGCPYQCEFCDIIVMFGRQPRTKSAEQIGRELDALRHAGVDSVFFVDDNLIGNKKTAKALLRYLADYQRRHGHPFQFGTEASLNLAADPELLTLFREAGFGWVFLGIETPDTEALAAARKVQNLKGDLLAAVHTLYRHGIDVFAGFVVGFDSDDTGIFERQYRFIVDSGIQVAMVGLLTALPKTPLYERLIASDRIRPDVPPGDNTRARTNVVPMAMTYQQMVDGYAALYRRLVCDRGIARRIRNKTRYLRRPVPAAAGGSLRERLGMLARVLRFGILPGGPSRWARFAATLACPPRLWPLVVTDWVRGLSMQDYVTRHMSADPEPARRRVLGTLEALRHRFADAMQRGVLHASADQDADTPALHVTVQGEVGRRFFRQVPRCLVRMLREPGTSLTLSVLMPPESQWQGLVRLLRRLDRYGERVSLRLREDLHDRLGVTLERVHLILEPVLAARG